MAAQSPDSLFSKSFAEVPLTSLWALSSTYVYTLQAFVHFLILKALPRFHVFITPTLDISGTNVCLYPQADVTKYLRPSGYIG